MVNSDKLETWTWNLINVSFGYILREVEMGGAVLSFKCQKITHTSSLCRKIYHLECLVFTAGISVPFECGCGLIRPHNLNWYELECDSIFAAAYTQKKEMPSLDLILATRRVLPTTKSQLMTALTTKEILRKAEIYFLGCIRMQKLYTQEVQHIVDVAGSIMKKKANIRLLYSGGNEILTQ